MYGYSAPWAIVDEPGFLYYSTDADVWEPIGATVGHTLGKDEPAPDTPRNPLPKPKEPERKSESEEKDPREDRWL